MNTKKHRIYVINTADNGKRYWNRAGVAFENPVALRSARRPWAEETALLLR